MRFCALSVRLPFHPCSPLRPAHARTHPCVMQMLEKMEASLLSKTEKQGERVCARCTGAVLIPMCCHICGRTCAGSAVLLVWCGMHCRH
jgi:hypothetical protein